MLDSNKVKNKLSVENIIKLCCELQGSDEFYYDQQGHPIFNTCIDHEGGDSFKLTYYPETHLFHCYTRGTSKDIFEIVQYVKDCDFKTAFDFVIKYFKFRQRGFEEKEPEELISDWDIFQKIEDYGEKIEDTKIISGIQENLIEYFYPLAAPVEWLKDGISADVMYHYGIRVDSALHKIIIPHRNINGELIGIRGRTYDPIELDKGQKYMPVFIEGDMYAHPLGKNLFGIYENKEVIKRIKKVCVFEAEKSVMQVASMYGVENCFAVATCGSNFSKDQMDLLLQLGVEEVIVAYDADHLGSRSDPDTKEYEEKLFKVVSPLLPYVNVSIIFDYDHILPHKASPSDCGKEKFEELYHKRIKLHSYSQNYQENKHVRKK